MIACWISGGPGAPSSRRARFSAERRIPGKSRATKRRAATKSGDCSESWSLLNIAIWLLVRTCRSCTIAATAVAVMTTSVATCARTLTSSTGMPRSAHRRAARGTGPGGDEQLDVGGAALEHRNDPIFDNAVERDHGRRDLAPHAGIERQQARRLGDVFPADQRVRTDELELFGRDATRIDGDRMFRDADRDDAAAGIDGGDRRR